jgi:hypothetical protein
MNKIKKEQHVLIYQAKSGALEIKSDINRSTIWARQSQIAEIFGVDRSVITKHIKNILSDEELDKKAVCAKFAHTGGDGKVYQAQHYNLDIILAIGYRANSARAIEFRKWATKTLRSYIVDGYAINKNRISKNYQQFLEAVDDIKKILPKNANIDTESVLELISMFASTWLSLDAYDKDDLTIKGATRKKVVLTAEKLSENLGRLKQVLIEKREATSIFGSEREGGSMAGIVGSVMQTFDGRELYKSVEEKAAHLLYFIVKSHPFVDGNKRSAAFSFVWFLSQAKILDKTKISPAALTALTILVAESNPKEKDKAIRLILTLLAKR